MSVIDESVRDFGPWMYKDIREENRKIMLAESLEFQLGVFVGEWIVSRGLPTLSTDLIRSKNIYDVSEEDAAENARLGKLYLEAKESNGEEKTAAWEAYHKHNKFLEKKYFPSKIQYDIRPLNVENMDEFKKGLSDALWNSDICVYDITPENIKVYHDDWYSYTTIELVLDETRY